MNIIKIIQNIIHISGGIAIHPIQDMSKFNNIFTISYIYEIKDKVVIPGISTKIVHKYKYLNNMTYYLL
jgi:hypothetical protein